MELTTSNLYPFSLYLIFNQETIIMYKFTIPLIAITLLASCGGDSTNSTPTSTSISPKPSTDEQLLVELQVELWSAISEGFRSGDFNHYAALCCDSLKPAAYQLQAFWGFISEEKKQDVFDKDSLYQSPKSFSAEVNGNTAFVSLTPSAIISAVENGFIEETERENQSTFTWIQTESGWVMCSP
jgi:hypothetical protein